MNNSLENREVFNKVSDVKGVKESDFTRDNFDMIILHMSPNPRTRDIIAITRIALRNNYHVDSKDEVDMILLINCD